MIILNDQSPVSRNRFIEILADRGIGTSVHYKPLHRMTYYRERYNLRPVDFPNAERIWKGCVSLTIYPSLLDEEIEYVCKVIWEVLSWLGGEEAGKLGSEEARKRGSWEAGRLGGDDRKASLISGLLALQRPSLQASKRFFHEAGRT